MECVHDFIVVEWEYKYGPVERRKLPRDFSMSTAEYESEKLRSARDLVCVGKLARLLLCRKCLKPEVLEVR